MRPFRDEAIGKMSNPLMERHMGRIGAPVRIRTLLCLLFGLAVLLAPAATGVAAAQAGVPDHQMQMTESSHCNSTPSGQHDGSAGKTCCISTYLGLTVAPAAPMAVASRPARTPVSFIRALHRPHLGEIATPPPRTA